MLRRFTQLLLLVCLIWLPLIGRSQVIIGPGEGGGEFPPAGGTLVIGGYPYVTLTPSTPVQSYFYNGSYPVSQGTPWGLSGGGQIVYQDQNRVDIRWTTAGTYQVDYWPTQRNIGEKTTLDVEVTCAPAGAGNKPINPIALGNVDPSDCTRAIPVADVNFVPGNCGGYTNDFGGGGIDIFYTFGLAHKADVEISTCRSNFDTTILLQKLQDGTFVDVVFNDDNGSSCLTGQASINVPLGKGTYRFVIEGYSANNYGTLSLDITTRRPELQITVPATAEVVANSSVVLNVGGADTYTWAPTTGLSTLNSAWSSVTAAPTQTTTYTVTGSACNNTRQATKQVTVYVLPENRNYVVTHAVLDNVLPSGTLVDFRNEANLWGLGVANVIQSTAYLDDLGRPLQQVAKQASPLGKDIVVPMEYDVYGRSPQTYLPYTDQVNGLFKTDALGASGKQALFYQASADRIANDLMPTAGAVYEQSPLNRVLEQGAPGSAWQPGASHSVKFLQRTNTTGDAVRQWAYSFTGNFYSSDGTYGAGQLLVKESRDEQDQLVTEYADLLGRTVLKRVAMTQTVCQALTLSNNTQTGTLVLTAPAGMKFTGIRAATYGEGTGTGGACENFTFGSSTVDVTEAIRTSVASQLPSNAGTLNVAFDATAFGAATGTRALAVVATYAPTAGALADLQTYYVYDDFNNLRLVISPEGVNNLLSSNTWTLTSTDAFVRNWCFQYGYDERQRVVTKQTPGTAPVSLVYNQRNQVVLTQDGAQAAVTATKNWVFTKYDGLGRPVVTGTVSLPSATRASLQTTMDAETNLTESADGSDIGYSLTTAYPTNVSATNNVLTVTYYDSYGFQRLAGSSLTPSVNAPVRTSLVRGLVTGTSVRQLTSANAPGADANGYGGFLNAAMYYDAKYRVLQSVGTNHLNGTDRLTNTLDFAGRTKVYSLLHSANGASHTVANRFDYYDNGQLRTTWQTMDAQPEIILSHWQYNELGQLAAKRLHSTAAVAVGAQYLQKVDYWYNIRGWLTNINDRDLTNGAVVEGQDAELDTNADPDLFGMELRYNTLLQDQGTAQYNGAKAQYNGNIAQAMWRTRPVGVPMTALRLYHYHYDPSNRITDAPYAEFDVNRGWVNTTNRITSDKDFSVSGIDYDGNGNLLHMTRKGLVSGSTTNPVTGILDQLSYSYKSAAGTATGNQLTAVNDAAPSGVATHDFKGTATNGQVKYRYDENGNLIGDDNKNISAIAYSLLNQPTKVNQSTNRIEYTYTATGTKLQKRTYSNNSLLTTTDYMGSFVYEQAVPVFVQSAEGRVLLTSSTTLPWKYEYHIKDHLGNLRFAFRADRDGGTESQLAGLEPSNSAKEEQQFSHLAETRLADPAHARTGNYVARLNAHTGRRQGPSIRVPVAAGDSIRAEVYGRYDHESVVGTWLQRGALVTGAAVAGTAGGVNTEFTQVGIAKQRKQPFFSLSLGIVPQLLKIKPAEVPLAFLRYELFTRDSQLVATHVQPISRTSTDTWQHLQAGTKVDSAGFARISLVNESGVPAYFDDMAVNVVAPNPYQENHYDPFGLNLVGIEKVGSPNSRFQYNGKEKQEEFGLNWADYGARMYDAQLGRWHAIDPLSEQMVYFSPYTYGLNNPIRFLDLDGLKPTPAEAIAMANHVYKTGNQGLLNGWHVSALRNGLNLENADSGFDSEVYEVVRENGTIEYAYVNRGTDVTSLRDWANDVTQAAIGRSAQYKQSVRNAEALDITVGERELTFIGHSLGGGMAIADALATGRGAMTFNAAGVSNATKKRLGLGKAEYVESWVVKGEIVSHLQDKLSWLRVKGAEPGATMHYLDGKNGDDQNETNNVYQALLKVSRRAMDHKIEPMIEMINFKYDDHTLR